MRFTPLFGLLGLSTLTAAAGSDIHARDYNANDYYVLQVARDVSPDDVGARLGIRNVGPVGELDGHYLFAAKREEHDVVKRELHVRRRLKRDLGDRDVLDSVDFSHKLKVRAPWEKREIPAPKPRGYADILAALFAKASDHDDPVDWAVKKQEDVAKELDISDPIFKDQWHLFNPVQIGHDVNVTGTWLAGVTGQNATVAIIDDGLDMYSNDLKANYYAKGSYDFNDHNEEPKPKLADDRHGTRCAGEVAAARNDVCGVGVAYDAKVAGLRILSKLISDADEAVAMNYDFHNNQIYSCSWGPPDDGRSMDAPGVLIRRAMLNAIQKGRNGLGSIYVFASGNGAANDDNCNFDGYTNSIYSITVGAVDRKGLHPYYSEKCSAQLVVTYSSGSGDAIHTTDVGPNNCYSNHGGTSAAAPLAAGIFALVLQVRPELSWRDMQYIAMDTAIPINPDDKDSDWQTTTIGKKFSHTFGYGKIDTYAIVEAAKTWKSVKPQAWYYSPWVHVNQAIPQGDKGLAVSFEVTRDMLQEANLERLEHVTVTMNVDHTRRGDLSVDLVSPNKIVSHLSTTRRSDNVNKGYVDWTFMSVAHWGESGIGTWTIVVRDTKVNEHNGTFVDWHLKLWGESIDPKKAVALAMPNEDDDKDHASIATTTKPATVTTLPPGAANTNTDAAIVPTDHPDRPINSKPTSTASSGGSGATGSSSASDATQAQETDSNWISWLPTFGVSRGAQAWIYGAIGLILVFCVGLGIYMFIARRRRLNNSRDNYEFELIDEEEGQGLASGEKGAFVGTKGHKTRGGELYDAFAGGSDDDDETDGYRDRAEEAMRGHRVSGEEQHVVGEDDDDDDEDEVDEKGALAGRR